MKGNNHMIILIDTEKTFDRFLLSLIIKNTQKTRNIKNFFYMIKTNLFF